MHTKTSPIANKSQRLHQLQQIVASARRLRASTFFAEPGSGPVSLLGSFPPSSPADARFAGGLFAATTRDNELLDNDANDAAPLLRSIARRR